MYSDVFRHGSPAGASQNNSKASEARSGKREASSDPLVGLPPGFRGPTCKQMALSASSLMPSVAPVCLLSSCTHAGPWPELAKFGQIWPNFGKLGRRFRPAAEPPHRLSPAPRSGFGSAASWWWRVLSYACRCGCILVTLCGRPRRAQQPNASNGFWLLASGFRGS